MQKGRSPHGERGLKSQTKHIHQRLRKSLSSRRAWIEIPMIPQGIHGLTSRSPHGERGLKYDPVSRNGCYRQVALLTESVD